MRIAPIPGYSDEQLVELDRIATLSGDTLYPVGYGKSLVDMATLIGRFAPKMHPEFARRLFWYLWMRQGLGIGSGWRKRNPSNRPGFAPPGRSFHESQQFTGGPYAYAAVDLVCRNGSKVHRAPYTAENPHQGTSWARDTGVHINVGTPGSKGYESWHMQPIELDGYGRWESAGKPDLRYGYPIANLPAPPTPPAPAPDPDPDPRPHPGGTMSDTTELVEPIRLLDTRKPEHGARPLAHQSITKVSVDRDAIGAMVTLTAVSVGTGGHAIAWAGGPRPVISNLNWKAEPGATANTTVTKLNADGDFFVYVHGEVHLVVDLVALYRTT